MQLCKIDPHYFLKDYVTHHGLSKDYGRAHNMSLIYISTISYSRLGCYGDCVQNESIIEQI